DSVFHGGHVSTLIQLAMINPEIDAIAPLQANRHVDRPLFGVAALTPKITEDGTDYVDRAHYEVDLAPVPHAHFGLTLIKVEALRKLPQPWFIGVPNKQGQWRDGKIDADINFWRKWLTAGCSLMLAPRVVIGHLELMVRWPDINMQSIWQAAKDWEHSR